MITYAMISERAKELHERHCTRDCKWCVDGYWLQWAKAELEDEFKYHGGTEPLF